MRSPDLDRARSEKILTFGQFLSAYNENLPAEFLRATTPLLREFQKSHLSLFKEAGVWSLDQHRKKVIDWLISRNRAPTE
jgi:hypothetical protein